MLATQRPPEKKEGGGFFGKLLRKVDGCDFTFFFEGKDSGARVIIDDVYDKTSERINLYTDEEVVAGKITLAPKNSNYKHTGVLVEFDGVVKTLGDREEIVGFVHQEKRYDPDVLNGPAEIPFSFDARKEYESYRGINAKVQYVVRCTIMRPVKNVSHEEEIWVSRVDHKLTASQTDSSLQRSYFRETAFAGSSVSMDVGVENLLHIEFKYHKKIFHLNECILGKVTFKVMDLDLQYGEVGVVRKEFIGSGKADDPVETETLQKFEIMDGTPAVGEVVPIRLYLKSIPRLTPSYTNVHNSFRVRYFVNLVLVTGEGKRYFKQQEITLYRRDGQVVPTNCQTNQEEAATTN